MHSKDTFYDPYAVAQVVEAISAQGDARDVWGYGLQNTRSDQQDDAVGCWAPVPFDIYKYVTGGMAVSRRAAIFGASLVGKLGGYDTDFGTAADQLFILQAALLRDPVTLQRVVSNFDCTGGGSIRPLAGGFRDVQRMCDVEGRCPLRGRRRSLDYMRMWEAVDQGEGCRVSDHKSGRSCDPRIPITPQVATDEPHGGPQERIQRLTQRAADALLHLFGIDCEICRTDERMIALTFDDGPDPEWDPRILDILAGQQSHGTFFMLIKNARAFPELVRRVVAEGHEVGLHGLNHRNLIGGSRRWTRRLLEGAASELAGIAGMPVGYFRPPYNAQTVTTYTSQHASSAWKLCTATWTASIGPRRRRSRSQPGWSLGPCPAASSCYTTASPTTPNVRLTGLR